MGDKKLEARVSGPVATSMALKRKAELAAKVKLAVKVNGLIAAGVHALGDVVSSEGWCTLPSGSTVHTTHEECVKRGGIWSPARSIGYIGGRFGGAGEESPAHEAAEGPAQENAEGEGSGSGSGSAPSAPAPSGGGSGGAS